MDTVEELQGINNMKGSKFNYLNLPQDYRLSSDEAKNMCTSMVQSCGFACIQIVHGSAGNCVVTGF